LTPVVLFEMFSDLGFREVFLGIPRGEDCGGEDGGNSYSWRGGWVIEVEFLNEAVGERAECGFRGGVLGVADNRIKAQDGGSED